MLKSIFTLVLSFFFLGTTQIALAQPTKTSKETSDPEATKLLDKVKKQYDAYKTVEAGFTLSIEVPGQPLQTQKGTLSQAGAKFRLTMPDQVIASDGKTNWIYLTKNNEIQITDVEEGSETGLLTPKDLLARYQKGDYIYAITEEVRENGIALTHIEFKPTDKNSEYSKLRVAVDKKTNRMHSLKAFAKDGSRYTFTITTFVPNKTFAANHFSLNPTQYKGVHVEDLRF